MLNTQDRLNFANSLESKGDHLEAPMLEKNIDYIIDNNGSNDYGRNQVQFDSTAISANHKWANYKEGFVSFPTMTVVTREDDISEAEGIKLISFKSGNHTCIDSFSVKFGNAPVIQDQAGIPAYLSFLQHSTWSLNDAKLNSHTGYRKNESAEWEYSELVGPVSHDPNVQPRFVNVTNNSSLATKEAIKNSGVNYYEKVGAYTHVFHYDCIVRLKDISSFFANMDLIKGAVIQLTFRLNQGTMEISNNKDLLTTSTNLKGLSNFVLRNPDAIPIVDGETEKISFTIGRNTVDNVSYDPPKSQCRLYMPNYTLHPDRELEYLSLGSKKITYRDVDIKVVKVPVGSNINHLLTTAQARTSRVIVVPMLDAHKGAVAEKLAVVEVDPDYTVKPVVPWVPPMPARAAVASHQYVSAQTSPFTSEPSTCSPHYFSNINLSINGQKLYRSTQELKYDNYLNEMNGNYGINNNLETGVSASLISYDDYNREYGYWVFDMSRRYAYDDSTPLNIQVTASNHCAFDMELMVYIEYEKDLLYDISTGLRIED